MGHREALLVGAKKCLFERGYARTTARDIVAASGTNLASIGYHFGSKEALLTAALIDAYGEWDDELVRVAQEIAPTGATGLEQIEALWAWMIDAFDRLRPLMVANIEAFAQAQHSEELRELLASYYQRMRERYVAESGKFIGSSDLSTQAIASFHIALFDGVILQWLIDPENAPSARDLIGALHALVEIANSSENKPVN
ncbi:TetR/AcrR family transcriptional regulator [Actinopolymorpha alba]|uniref:TetR/AcrR family transcriptional regulator n=1 Tax=Actinopolymorpha alba TaxID=533267 RepID=UPI000368358F|nr:TetR/AcrR family transcriptional regulator [Actinopolymorpha alba]